MYHNHYKDYLYLEDQRIFFPKECKVHKYDLFESQIKQLEELTELTCDETIFNSHIHVWSINTSKFNDKIIGNKKLIFLFEDENGEKFGCYLNTQIKNIYDKQKTK